MVRTLTPENVEELVSTVKEGTDALTLARAQMDESNKRVAELLKQQEELKQGGESVQADVKRINEELQSLGNRMETLASNFTDLTHTTRKAMRAVGTDGAREDVSYVHPNGRGQSIFRCRDEALQIGMYLMATMEREGAVKAGARKWLAERKNDLQYLPQITPSLVRDLGKEWQETIQQIDMNRPDWMAGEDLASRATPGSVLTRPQFADTLIRNVEEYGMFRQNALVWPMGAETVRIPRRSGGLTVYWEGEAEAGTETDPNFQLLGMTAKKPFMLHQYSSELSEDAALSLADILVFEFALAMATEEDRIGFNGTGAGGNSPGFAEYIGVLGADANATAATADSTFVPHLVTGAAGADLTTELTEAKLREMTGRLHTWAMAGAKWYMHRSVHADCDGIQMGTSGGSVVKYQDPRSPTIMGYPVVNAEGMPASPSAASTKVFALGDLRKSWILGDRRAPEMQTSEHYAFNTDQITIRMRARIAFLMQSGNGMVVYQTGTA